MKIEAFYLKNLHNGEHFQFQTEVTDLVVKYTPAALGIGAFWPAYVLHYNSESKVMELVRKSALTDELTLADTSRDELFNGLAAQVEAAALHYIGEIRQAGSRLQVVFDNYGDVARKSYDKETADIASLHSDLNTNHAADVATLNLTGWLTELQLRNNTFSGIMKDRYTEDAGKTLLRMKEARSLTDIVYRQIVNLINALIITNEGDDYSGFVNEMNARIQRYRTMVAQRKGRSNAEALKDAGK